MPTGQAPKAAALERDELVADVDERRAAQAFAGRELEEAPRRTMIASSTSPTSSATWLIPTSRATLTDCLRRPVCGADDQLGATAATDSTVPAKPSARTQPPKPAPVSRAPKRPPRPPPSTRRRAPAARPRIVAEVMVPYDEDAAESPFEVASAECVDRPRTRLVLRSRRAGPALARRPRPPRRRWRSGRRRGRRIPESSTTSTGLSPRAAARARRESPLEQERGPRDRGPTRPVHEPARNTPSPLLRARRQPPRDSSGSGRTPAASQSAPATATSTAARRSPAPAGSSTRSGPRSPRRGRARRRPRRQLDSRLKVSAR